MDKWNTDCCDVIFIFTVPFLSMIPQFHFDASGFITDLNSCRTIFSIQKSIWAGSQELPTHLGDDLRSYLWTAEATVTFTNHSLFSYVQAVTTSPPEIWWLSQYQNLTDNHREPSELQKAYFCKGRNTMNGVFRWQHSFRELLPSLLIGWDYIYFLDWYKTKTSLQCWDSSYPQQEIDHTGIIVDDPFGVLCRNRAGLKARFSQQATKYEPYMRTRVPAYVECHTDP